MHLVSSGGQHHLISQPAQVAVLSTASTHPVHTSPAPIGTQLPLSVSSQGFPLSPLFSSYPHHHPNLSIHTIINLDHHPLTPTKTPPPTPPLAHLHHHQHEPPTTTPPAPNPLCTTPPLPFLFLFSILLYKQSLGRTTHSGVIGWKYFFHSLF